MGKKLTIAVLFGGRSGEHEVSLLSARSVLSVLDAEKYTILQVALTKEGQWLSGPDALTALENGDLSGLRPVLFLPDAGNRTLYAVNWQGKTGTIEPLADVDVVFPVLHGTFGEDGTLQGFLEMADLAYVGAGVLGSAVGMDKGLFKSVMRANGIPVLDWVVFNRKDIEAQMPACLEQAEALASYPLFVKPANLGSSVGISKVKSRADLLEGLMEAARFDRRVLVERGLDAREIEVSVMGNERPTASLPGEIRPSDEFYTYAAKYLDDRSELLPRAADLAPEQIAQIQSYAVQAYQLCDCAGLARVDFLMEKQTGRIYLNEINTMPGFTKISMYPKMWEASGVSYMQLVERLIELALERKAERDRTEHSYRRDA